MKSWLSLTLLGFFALCSSAILSAAEPVVDHSSELELIRDDFGLADGPSWNDQGGLYVPDVKGSQLNLLSTKANRWSKPILTDVRISATFYNHGRLYVSDNGNSRIAVLEDNKLKTIYQHDKEARPAQKPNDLVVDMQGGIYYTLTGPGEVRYIDPETQDSKVVANLSAPNGIILSPDEATLYVSAYADKQVWSYPVKQPGQVGEGKLFATMDDGPEKGADGMCTDRAGNVYCCGASDVCIWNPAGELIEKFPTPTRPINCTFGDNEMQSLYITGFGGLYRQKMNVSGRSPEPTQKQTSNQNRPSTEIPADIEAHRNVVYAEYGSRKLLADLFVPTTTKRDQNPAIVVVHGGGWVKGDKTKFRALAIALAKRGYTTMAIEYRLAGEAKFPAGIHDCNAAVRYLRAHAKEYHANPQQITAVGGSAGGHLVGLMATGSDNPELQGTGGWQDQSSKLQAAVVMAGPLQILTGSVAETSRKNPDFYSNQWIGKSVDEGMDLYRLADAYEQISAGDSPILFITGELDNPPRNQPAREKLKDVGVTTDLIIYPNAKHGCWNQLPWFDQVVEDVDKFLKAQLN